MKYFCDIYYTSVLSLSKNEKHNAVQVKVLALHCGTVALWPPNASLLINQKLEMKFKAFLRHFKTIKMKI